MADELSAMEAELQEELEGAIEDAPAAGEETPVEETGEVTEPIEETVEEGEPETKVEEKPAPKTVPLAELLKERDKRKALETELAVNKARQEERDRIENERRAAQQQEQQTQTQQQQVQDALKAEVEKQIGKRPSDEDDPIGAQEWDRQYQGRKMAHDAEEARRIASRTELNTHLLVERTQFMQTNPDYQEALDYAVNREKEDYMEMGYPEHVALQIVNARAGELIQMARRAGKNVAATFYAYAVRRGYAKAAPAATEAAPEVKAPSAAEKLQTAEAGKKITSLANGAGGQASTSLTDDQIDNMSSAELHEWMKNPKNEARYRRMLGEV